mgnify:CR=1 FL=1
MWNSTGVDATVEQQTNIPPVNGNMTQGSTLDEFMTAPATTRKLYEQDPIEANIRGRRLEKNYTELEVNMDAIIAGGWYRSNDTIGDSNEAKFDNYMASTIDPVDPGPRTLGPWDCKGLTGVLCCAMIKHSVRDADVNGRAIQCWINPVSGEHAVVTPTACEEDLTKVCIYETIDGKVDATPILAFDNIIDDAVAAGRDIEPDAWIALRDA